MAGRSTEDHIAKECHVIDDLIPSASDFFGTVLPFTVISYLIVLGTVAMVLTSVQEGARLRERPAMWGMHEWSQLRMIGVSGLIASPSIPILMLIAALFLV